MTVLEIKNLTKRFGGVAALDHLSIAIERGTITSIVGPNGSGKTTLINLLTGMLPIDGGTVMVQHSHILQNVRMSGERGVTACEVASYGITRTFQEVRLFNQMAVLDNVLVVLTERNVFGALFERHGEFHLKKAEEILKRVGLWEKRDGVAANLSYGQRKLLEIARAIAVNADIYLFDEPFAGLFPEMTKTVLSIIKELRMQGKTIVLIEHNMELIRDLSDWVVVMDGGKLLAEGKPNEVLKRRDVVEAYLGE